MAGPSSGTRCGWWFRPSLLSMSVENLRHRNSQGVATLLSDAFHKTWGFFFGDAPAVVGISICRRPFLLVVRRRMRPFELGASPCFKLFSTNRLQQHAGD